MLCFPNHIYLLVYIVTMIYFVILGCYMLMQRSNIITTRGEQEAKQRMTRSVGLLMLSWAFDFLIYLFPMLEVVALDSWQNVMCFFISLVIDTPLLYMMIFAIVQKRVNTLRWTMITVTPFLLLTICYLCLPKALTLYTIHAAEVLHILFIVFLFVKYTGDYRNYIERMKSEYSEISHREIFWSWFCFAGFTLQTVADFLYAYYFEPAVEIVYWIICITNGTYLCFCTCRQRPLDPEAFEADNEEEKAALEDIPQTKSEEKAFHAIIEQKLESLCEAKYLYLEPDLTRETLCRRLCISSTYLKLYFRGRGLTFYQYINTLRVEYAYKLMEENPEMSIHDVSERSGFRSQTTFRRMFVEVIGCLPSDVRTNTVAKNQK